MRVLLTHPFFWPYVRRGAEREVHDLGIGLAAGGHRVRLVTGSPVGLTRRARFAGMSVRYVHAPVPTSVGRRGVTDVTAFAAVAAAATAVTRADLVHCFHYADAWGALRARRLRSRLPVVLKLTGTVRAQLLDRLAVDRRMFREAVVGADAVWCNSAFARAEMAEFGVPMEVVPAGVDLARFRPVGPRAARPTVFAASASLDPRKRFKDLVAAWPSVRARVPGAQLRVAGMAGPDTLRLIGEMAPAARESVVLLGELPDESLVREYSAAWLSVTAALYEALGLTTVESLAAGTPVVAADSGASPEILVAPHVGRLFRPAEPEDCAAALVQGLVGPPTEGVSAACRLAAEPYAWERVLPRVLAGYERVLCA